jgi:hypothetical protein
LLFGGAYLAATEAGIETAHNPNLYCAKTQYMTNAAVLSRVLFILETGAPLLMK